MMVPGMNLTPCNGALKSLPPSFALSRYRTAMDIVWMQDRFMQTLAEVHK